MLRSNDQYVPKGNPETEYGLAGARKPGKYFRILAIDGGGVRGIIPTMVLRYIELRTGRKIHELFNLVSGTSTGALLGAVLTVPGEKGEPRYNTDDALGFYMKECPRIFERTLLGQLMCMSGLAGPRYQARTKREIVEAYAGELNITDCLTDILVPAFDVRTGRPYFFKSITARMDPKYDYKLKDVLDATSAAPTYFRPCKVIGYDAPSEHGYRSFVDGAITANSPSLCATVDAMRIYKEKPDDILVVSLGCGDADIGLAYDKMSKWGGLKWASYIPSALISSSMSTVDYHTDELLDDANYWRFQTKVPSEHADIDNATPENLKWLKTAGELLVSHNRERLNALCDLLVEGMPDMKCY
ncbi:hypothetical protein DSO57_1015098 [Entomophthora muscae]|uniref:Uncharacterized protein n=2 Tax=Entomophthora muscae TaxID=34485 RepID=A0ACC2U3W9_9FUNG|nr:hypothetical protein DSO57_1000898 [Entomophthora muscae]KAJ9081391.1 hypothetical protein DSO57_1015098 [Entomophthora muscae]